MNAIAPALTDIGALADFVLMHAVTAGASETLAAAASRIKKVTVLERCAYESLQLDWRMCGETELVRCLVVELTDVVSCVSTIKRVSDAVDLERQGSGTLKHVTAGAVEVMVASASQVLR